MHTKATKRGIIDLFGHQAWHLFLITIIIIIIIIIITVITLPQQPFLNLPKKKPRLSTFETRRNFRANRVFSTEHTIAWYPGQKTLDALPFILQFNFYEGRCVKFFDKCQFVSKRQ